MVSKGKLGGMTSALAVVAGVVVAGCNTHPVDYSDPSALYGASIDFSPENAAAVDILWVIDNSASMCEEQEALADEFDAFITQFAEQNIDFQIGVTTTHQRPEGLQVSFKSQYGQLQSRPDPIPSSNCGDEASEIAGALRRALQCTRDPTPTAAQRDCLDNLNCGETFRDYEAIFPSEADYRDIPLVMRASDPRYRVDGALDVDAVRRDFGCMAFVGTNGWYFEKGLGAAMKATSPEMVGNVWVDPADNPDFTPPADAPNYGLVREDADFAMVFVTDENDCTYDNARVADASKWIMEAGPDATFCNDDVCDYANKLDPTVESPLIPPEEIAQTIVDNLNQIKRADLRIEDLIVASIHGQPKRYEGTVYSETDCEAGEQVDVGDTCNSATFGAAKSGDRYQRFVETFAAQRRFPSADDPVKGKMCDDTLIRETLREIGGLIVGSSDVCIDEKVYRCTADEQCPADPFTGEAAACEAFAESGERYCPSAIQLVMEPAAAVEDAAGVLAATGYCIPETIDNADLNMKGRCVVSKSQYALPTCAGNDLGVTVIWNSPTYFDEIGGFDVEISYAIKPDAEADVAGAP